MNQRLQSLSGNCGGSSVDVAASRSSPGSSSRRRRYASITCARTPVVAIVARTREQARAVYGYSQAALERVGGITGVAWTHHLKTITGVRVLALANSPSVRGYTVVSCVMDEIAHWNTAPTAGWTDKDLVTALRPAMVSIPDAVMVAVSSPWRRAGMLHDIYDGSWASPAERIVWHGNTRSMNPTISQERIDEDIRLYPALAAEYAADFFVSGDTWLPPYVLAPEKVATWPADRPPLDDYQRRKRSIRYVAFADTAGGGQGGDAAALAIAHRETVDGVDRLMLDATRRVTAPFVPSNATLQFAELLKRYGVQNVTADNYASGFQRESWSRDAGVGFTVSSKTKHQIYSDMLPSILDERCDLTSDAVMIGELRELCETRDSGVSRIDHPDGGTDDVANAAMGALWLCRQGAVYTSTGGRG